MQWTDRLHGAVRLGLGSSGIPVGPLFRDLVISSRVHRSRRPSGHGAYINKGIAHSEVRNHGNSHKACVD